MLKLTLLVASLLLVQCTKNEKETAKDPSRNVVQALADDEVILEYNGGTITGKDVNATLRPQLEQIRQQILTAYAKAAEDVFAERMADKQDPSGDKVTEAELEVYLKANNLPKTDSEKIREFLGKEKQRIKKQILVMQLNKNLNVKNRLTAIRYDVAVTATMPVQGKESAAVTVQEFCDFGNPSCNRARLAMTQLLTELGDNGRWIYRHFPVASSPIGQQAALVAICAHQQKKFWNVHNRFFDQQANLTHEKLVKEAVEAGVDEGQLKTCLQSAGTQAELDAELAAAQMLGISSTPVYFVNGVRVTDVDQLFIEARKHLNKSKVATQAE